MIHESYEQFINQLRLIEEEHDGRCTQLPYYTCSYRKLIFHCKYREIKQILN